MPLDRVRVLLSAQRALLGAIGPALLGVYVEWGDDWLRVTACADRVLDDDEREAIRVAASEMCADLPEVARCEEVFIERGVEPLTGAGTCVFLRRTALPE